MQPFVSGFIHVIACFLSLWQCIDMSHFVYHLLVDGHFVCLHILAIMSNVAMNIHVQGFVWHIFDSLGNIPRHGVNGSYGNSV